MAMLPAPFDSQQSGMSGMSFNPWMMALGLGGMGGGLAGMMNNPSEAAMGYTNQLPGTVSPYYDPYIQAGQRSMGTLENQFNQLINDPASIYAMLAPQGGFQQSPGYQWQMEQGMNAATNAAASGGQAGGSAHQQQAASLGTNMANQDYYNWMNQVYNPEFERMLGLYGSGLSGLSGLNTMGYNASDSLASLLAQNLMNQAQLASTSAQQQNSSMGGLLGGAATAVGSFF
jgi:hypothetical protein